MADIQSVLRSLERSERLMHEIYGELAEVLAADAEAASLFSRLAFEELSHLGQVQFLRRLVRQNGSEFGDIDLDCEALAREVAQLEAVREAARRLSLREALVLAIQFEDGVAELHARRAISKANPEVARLFGTLHVADERHRDTLIEMAVQRGFRSR